MGIGMQQADRHGPGIFSQNGFGEFRNGGFIQGDQNIAIDGQAFADGQASVAWHQWRGAIDAQIIVIKSLFIALLDHIAKALGGDESRGGTFAFDQGVGGEGCAMNADGDIGRLDGGFGDKICSPFQHGHFRCLRGGEEFTTPALFAIFKDNVGESATNVGGQFVSGLHAPPLPQARGFDK